MIQRRKNDKKKKEIGTHILVTLVISMTLTVADTESLRQSGVSGRSKVRFLSFSFMYLYVSLSLPQHLILLFLFSSHLFLVLNSIQISDFFFLCLLPSSSFCLLFRHQLFYFLPLFVYFPSITLSTLFILLSFFSSPLFLPIILSLPLHNFSFIFSLPYSLWLF